MADEPGYASFLNRNVDEILEDIDEFEGDLEQLKQVESRMSDRKTVLNEIEGQIEAREESEEDDKDEHSDTDSSSEDESNVDMGSIKEQVEGKFQKSSGDEKEEDIDKEGFLNTGIEGFDSLFTHGIPEGSPILVAGGAGSGKTIFCLQMLNHHASKGEKCLFMSFEEPEENLISHMEEFGWDPNDLIEEGHLKIDHKTPFGISRQVEAMLAKEKGELMIDIDPVILPDDYDPDFVVIDSLTALQSTFTGSDDSYRIYIEQLFRFFERRDITTFLISETGQDPDKFSPTGVEEFLADGVIVLYNIKHGNVRESAIEILKMRGEDHKKKMVSMRISDNGINVFPEQEVLK